MELVHERRVEILKELLVFECIIDCLMISLVVFF